MLLCRLQMEVSFIACLTFAEDRRERLIIRSTLLESNWRVLTSFFRLVVLLVLF